MIPSPTTPLSTSCTLTALATAGSPDALPAFDTPEGTSWPLIAVDLPLTDAFGALQCTRHPLNAEPEGVGTHYTGPEGGHRLDSRFAGASPSRGGIVLDDLLVHLDGADPASYQGTGGTWFDLAGADRHASLANGPTVVPDGGGAFSFAGSSDFALLAGGTPPSLLGDPAFTVEGWFKRAGSWSDGATWGIGGATAAQGINAWNHNSTDAIAIDLWGTSTYTTGQTYSPTAWRHIAWVYQGGGFTTANIVIHVDGVPYTGPDLGVIRGGSGAPNINTQGIVLGRADPMTNLYHGNPIIGDFRVYGRALSPAEVAGNRLATAARFTP